MPSRTNRSPLAWLRAALSGFVVLPLLCGVLEIHAGTAAHQATEGTSWLATAARHPLQPHHLEASTAVRTPGCPACVLQLQGACDGVAHAPVLSAPDLPVALPRPDAVAARPQSHPAAASRGPPAA